MIQFEGKSSEVQQRLGRTKPVAEQREAERPDGRAADIVQRKRLVGHASHSRHERRKSAHDGNETGQNDSLTAVLSVILLCLADVCLQQAEQRAACWGCTIMAL